MAKDCKGCPSHNTSTIKRKQRMSQPREIVMVPLPPGQFITQIEVFYGDPNTPERKAQVSAGATDVKVKLAEGAKVEDCMILVKQLDATRSPTRVYVYCCGSLKPYNQDVHKLGSGCADCQEAKEAAEAAAAEAAAAEAAAAEAAAAEAAAAEAAAAEAAAAEAAAAEAAAAEAAAAEAAAAEAAAAEVETYSPYYDEDDVEEDLIEEEDED
jgi:hypothetical protein